MGLAFVGRTTRAVFSPQSILRARALLFLACLPWDQASRLWRLKVKSPKTARVVLMGVRKRFQQSALGAALVFLLIDAVRGYGIRRGVQEVELSWILEDNMPMRNMITMVRGVPYKRYRIYEKAFR